MSCPKRVRPSVWLLACAALGQLALAPKPAAACGPCSCFVPSGVRPGNLRDDVPLNARFLLALRGVDEAGAPQTVDPADISWTDADGVAVAFDLMPTNGTGDEVWLVPQEDLAANTDYRIGVIDGNGASTTVFTTGAVRDEMPPEASAPRAEPIESSPACGAFYGARLTWDEIRDGGESIGYDPVVTLEVEHGSEAVTLFTTVSQLYPERAVDIASPGDHESGACWGQLALPFGMEGDTIFVTATIHDAAGNAIELERVEATLGSSPGGVCPSDGSDGEGGASAERGGGMCAAGAVAGHPVGFGWTGLLAGGLALLAVAARTRGAGIRARPR